MCIHSHIACPQAKEAQQHSTHTLHSYMCTFANCHQHVAGIGTQTRVYICVSYMHRLQLARCWHHTHIRVYILQIAITALLIFYIYVCIHLHFANTQAKRAHRKAACHLRYTKWTYMSTYVIICQYTVAVSMNTYEYTCKCLLYIKYTISGISSDYTYMSTDVNILQGGEDP